MDPLQKYNWSCFDYFYAIVGGRLVAIQGAEQSLSLRISTQECVKELVYLQWELCSSTKWLSWECWRQLSESFPPGIDHTLLFLQCSEWFCGHSRPHLVMLWKFLLVRVKIGLVPLQIGNLIIWRPKDVLLRYDSSSKLILWFTKARWETTDKPRLK